MLSATMVRMNRIELHVNGRPVAAEVQPATLLVELLRGPLGLTGTHVGCDTSQCGCCTVLLDGDSVKACSVLAVQAAFQDCHGLQCGFCTPGMIMSAIDLVKRHDGLLDEAAVREGLEGNICRCTGYHNIVRAVLTAAERL